MDIEIGGAGMRNFYDKELVSVANKIGKKIGARKVEPFKLGRIKGWAMNLPPNPVRVKSADNYFDLPLYMPDSPVSDTSIPQVVKEAAKRPKVHQSLRMNLCSCQPWRMLNPLWQKRAG